MVRIFRTVLPGLLGAAGAYLFDPHSGARRRNVARDRAAAFFRRRSREATQKARYARGVAEGVAHKAAQAAPGGGTDAGPIDDVTLAQKVGSEIFRDQDAPKGDVNVNAEHGVIYLRGQVKRPEQIQELVHAARKVEGVKDVENLLHLPKPPAPAKTGGQGRAAVSS